MKTLETNCRNCGASMRIDVEEQEAFSDEGLCAMATCNDCYCARERIEKANLEKFDRVVERELSQPAKPSKPWRNYKQPYRD